MKPILRVGGLFKWAAIGCAVIGCAVIGCAGANDVDLKSLPAPENVVEKGDRRIGFGVTEGSIGYMDAFAEANLAGIEFIELPQQWDDIETTEGRFESEFLAMANDVYPKFGTGIVLSLNPIDTGAVRIPDYLKGKKIDSPDVIEAFKRFVDFSIDGLPDADIVAISIGNEVDGYLADSDQAWIEYTKFFTAVREHIKQRRPDAVVGVKTTWRALLQTNTANITTLNADADAIMVTYYPLNEEFLVSDLDSIDADIAHLVDHANPKPLHLLETGFPSGDANDSSLEKQRQFIDKMFALWDKHGTSMPLVNFVWLCDMSSAEVAQLTKYYRVATPAFASFLGTLGLKGNDGSNKPAFDRILQHTEARGW